MVDLDQWMQAVNYEVTGGWKPLLKAFGEHTHAYECTTVNKHGKILADLCCEFNKITKDACLIEAHDYINDKSYRWVRPDLKESYIKECASWDESFESFETTKDRLEYIDLETESDILSKTMSIFEGFPYDDRVEVPIDLDDKELFDLMRQAHLKDVTLNQYVASILENYIENFNSNRNNL